MRRRFNWIGGSTLAGTLLIMSCVGALSGCGGGTSAVERNRSELNRDISALESQTSVVAAKEELGEPSSEVVDAKGDLILYYRGWLLEFREDRLVRRIHETFRRVEGAIKPSAVPSTEVLLLRRGMALRSVVAKLGPPDVIEDEYGANASPERVLRYGPWELRFDEGKLTMRTRR